MNTKFLITFIILTAMVVTPAISMQSSPAEDNRIAYNFNSDWRLYLGEAEGAENPGFNISDHVHFGDLENVIAVKTDNSWGYPEKDSSGTGVPGHRALDDQ